MTPSLKFPSNPSFNRAPAPGVTVLKARGDHLASSGKSLALTLFLIYLFVLTSRVTDFVLTGFHIPAFLFLMSIPASMLCGALPPAARSRTGLFLAGFLLWVTAAIPFSVWKGGSISQLKTLLMSLAVFIPIVGLCTGFREVRKVFFTVGFGVACFSLFSLVAGDLRLGDRFALESGNYANANDLAQFTLMGAPIWFFVVLESRRNFFRAALAALVFAPMVLNTIRTGSRTLLLATGVMFLILFFRVAPINKVKLLLLSFVLVVVAVIVLPRPMLLRYVTFFTPVSGEDANGSAIESAMNRRQLLWDSIRYTLENPVFGVGPGMFPVVRGKEFEVLNKAGGWLVSHNAYTQISSECGIPAMIFWVLALGNSFVLTSRAARYHRGSDQPVSKSIRNAAVALQLSLVSFAIFAFFLSIAYQVQAIVLMAMAVALERVSVYELSKQKTQSQPAPVAQPSRSLGGLRLR